MRKVLYVSIAVAVMASLGAYLLPQSALAQANTAKDEPKTVTATGEVVDLWCYIDHEGKGADHKGCATACVKAGNPIGLVTDKGDVYVLMGSEKHQPGSAVALDKIAETVTITGKLIKKGGVQAIYVQELK